MRTGRAEACMGREALRRILFLSLLLAPCPPPQAFAAPPLPETLRKCPATADNAARLSCYDNALKGPSADPAALDNEALLGDVWRDEEDGGLLDSRWELGRAAKEGVFRLRPYKPVYLAPLSWTSKRNTMPSTPNPDTSLTTPLILDSLEAEFQISFKVKMAEGLFGQNLDLWGAYTQSSRWQLYNYQESRPFRETDYEPELLLTAGTNYKVLGWRGRLLGIGLNHQSNGRSAPLSRSWNRILFLIGFEREGWAVTARGWRRIDEPSDRDDNPDISDYMGRFDITVVRVLGNHQLSLTVRHSLKSGYRSHGAAQLEWAFPIRAPLRGHVQLFHGYGESLIDYNFKATWLSLGFSLVEWY